MTKESDRVAPIVAIYPEEDGSLRCEVNPQLDRDFADDLARMVWIIVVKMAQRLGCPPDWVWQAVKQARRQDREG
jgi:hypothetical protein